MAASVTVAGVITKPPASKTAKSGKRYASVTLVEHIDESDDRWWWVTAFAPEICDDLLKLKAGDAIKICGQLQTSVFAHRKDDMRVNHAASNITSVELIGGPSFHKQRLEELSPPLPIDLSEAPF